MKEDVSAPTVFGRLRGVGLEFVPLSCVCELFFEPGEPALTPKPHKKLELLHAPGDPVGVADEWGGRVGAFFFPVILQNLSDHL